jgi:hypothetical protein
MSDTPRTVAPPDAPRTDAPPLLDSLVRFDGTGTYRGRPVRIRARTCWLVFSAAPAGSTPDRNAPKLDRILYEEEQRPHHEDTLDALRRFAAPASDFELEIVELAGVAFDARLLHQALVALDGHAVRFSVEEGSAGLFCGQSVSACVMDIRYATPVRVWGAR